MKILWKIRPEHATIWENAGFIMKNRFDVEGFVDRRDCVAGITEHFQGGIEGKFLNEEAGRKASVRLLDTLVLAAKTNAGVLKSLGGLASDTRLYVEQFSSADLIPRICGNFRLMFCDILERSGITDLPEDFLANLERRIHDEFDDFLLRAPFDGSSPQSYWQAYFNGSPQSVLHNALSDKRRAETDVVTGLYNRRYGDERLQREFDIARNTGQMLTFSIVDIDHFKHINDKHGHGAGDQILQQVARFLRESLRLTDVVFRHGGDEFGVILPDTDASGARGVAEKIRSIIQDAEFLYQNGNDEKKLKLTVTFGIYSLCEGDDLHSLTMNADSAMLDVKCQGRNCIGVYRGSQNATISQNGDSPPKYLRN